MPNILYEERINYYYSRILTRAITPSKVLFFNFFNFFNGSMSELWRRFEMIRLTFHRVLRDYLAHREIVRNEPPSNKLRRSTYGRFGSKQLYLSPMKYARNQAKSLTNPSTGPSQEYLPSSPKKRRKYSITMYIYIYIYIRPLVKKIAAPTVTILLPICAVSGISFAIFRRPWRNRGICRRLFTNVSLNFARLPSPHPS